MFNSVWKAFMDPKLPKNYFRVEVNILRAMGIELYKEESIIYSILSKIFLLYTTIFFTGVEMYEFYAQWGNFNGMVGVCTYLITHLTGVVKTGILYKNRKKIGKMMLELHKPPFKPDVKRGGKQEEHLIRQAIRKTEILLVIYFCIITATITTGLYNTIVVRIRRSSESWLFPYVPTMSLGEYSHRSPYFEFGVLYQFLGVLAFAIIIATTYILLSTIMAHISVQMKILGNEFRTIRKRAEILADTQRNDQQIVNQHMEILMGKAISHHLRNLELAVEMESLCSLMILSIFIASVILMCFLLYFASLQPLGSVIFFQNISYWCIIVCQVGMYCYWGNEVSLESDNIAKEVAKLEWPGSNKHVTHAILMVIVRAQKPLYITAGKFVPLSMEVFMKIVKGSFSYFMVLRQAQEPDA